MSEVSHEVVVNETGLSSKCRGPLHVVDSHSFMNDVNKNPKMFFLIVTITKL